jgi:multiple sugar transport system ATP-binding protein
VPDLSLIKVVKRFGNVGVINGIDLDVEHGEFVVFVGPSGCGKSTLLRMIAGLEEVTDGEIVIDGVLVNEVEAAKRGLAMVFQSYALYPHMTVRKNLAFGLETMRTPKPVIKERVAEAARILKIEPLLDRRPAQLSGGQRQRVAIGRAIVREPKIFLFDEPLSNLDAELRVQMRVEIAKLHKRLGATMIYVTHDQVEAMTMADKIVVLRAGNIEQVGSPLDLYNEPRNQFVAGFIGSPRMNFLAATVRAVGDGGTEVALGDGTPVVLPRVAAGLQPGAPVTLGVRPEHLSVGDGDGPTVPTVVNLTEHLGGVTFFYATLRSEEALTIEMPGQAFVENGVAVPVRLDPELCHLFDGDGRAFPKARAPAARAAA